MSIDDKIKALLNSEISSYSIERYCGMPNSKVSGLRTKRYDINNLTYKTIKSLVDAYNHFIEK